MPRTTIPPQAGTPARPDLAVFIGRFQPFTLGHLSVVRRALAEADRVCVVVGSARGPRSHRNPFTYDERRHMIEACLSEEEAGRLTTVAVSDHTYDDTDWSEAVRRAVAGVARALAGDRARLALVGHRKDGTSYYLSMFPEWGSVAVENHRGLSATPMRALFFEEGAAWLDGDGARVLPDPVRAQLRLFTRTEAYRDLVAEYAFIRDYARQWGRGPFVTTDACVIASGHVLLVRRAGRPGRGQWALPGGFLDVDRGETLVEGMLRELREETGIAIGANKPEVVDRILRGSIVHSEAFDDPHRDPRARIITHAFLVALEPRPALPAIKAASDAAEARWVALADLREETMFADHHHVIARLRGALPK